MKFKKGTVPWNKGKKGVYSKETLNKMNEGRKKAWGNLELRKRQSLLTQRGMNKPEVRLKISQSKKGKETWMKGKKHSEESRKRMSASIKKSMSTPELRQKMSEIHKKRWLNPDYRHKMSEMRKGRPSPNKGKIFSEEYRLKLSLAHMGKPSPKKGIKTGLTPWNKGKTNVYSKETIEKMSGANNPRYGKPSHNKGKKFSDEIKQKLSQSHKGQTSWIKGKHHSEESRKRMSISQKKSMSNPELLKRISQSLKNKYASNPELIKQMSEKQKKRFENPEERQKSREAILKLYKSGSFPKQTNTKPEKQIKEELLKRGYKEGEDFIHQYNLMNKFMCDFCFPKQRVIVEVQGDFWHANPRKYPEGSVLHKHQLKGIGRDKSKKAYITTIDNHSWTYLEIWESDIEEDVSKCVDKIVEVLKSKNLQDQKI